MSVVFASNDHVVVNQLYLQTNRTLMITKCNDISSIQMSEFIRMRCWLELRMMVGQYPLVWQVVHGNCLCHVFC